MTKRKRTKGQTMIQIRIKVKKLSFCELFSFGFLYYLTPFISETTRARSRLVKKFEAGNFKWNIKKKKLNRPISKTKTFKFWKMTLVEFISKTLKDKGKLFYIPPTALNMIY
jgi:hypothetical protein